MNETGGVFDTQVGLLARPVATDELRPVEKTVVVRHVTRTLLGEKVVITQNFFFGMK